MKAIKLIIKVLGILIPLVLLIGSSYLYHSGPVLPDQTEEILESVITNPLPQMITGDTGYAQNQDVSIWYESISHQDTSKGVVLLIMGISNDAFGWPQNFINDFAKAGYQVIRYDHRGTGLSSWVENWRPEKPYTLGDMASDAVAILDKLNIEKAHIIGVSMGGMIAQELGILYPEKVQSLTSIMSSGNIMDQQLPAISSDVTLKLIRASLKYGIIGGKENMAKLHLTSRIILKGDAHYTHDIKTIAHQVIYNLRFRRGYNSKVSEQHQTAVMLSGSRYTALENLSLPTLIIHGKEDPFIPIAHGKKCASLIPKADSLWVDNMGHDIPEIHRSLITRKIVSHIKQANDHTETN